MKSDDVLVFLADSGAQQIRDVARHFGVHETTAAYHLLRLEHAGRVLSRRVGRGRFFFVRGNIPKGTRGLCPFLVEAIPAARNERMRLVGDLVQAAGRLTLTDLRRSLAVSDQTAGKYLDRLDDLGLVRFHRAGRGTPSFAEAVVEHAVCLRHAWEGTPCMEQKCVRDAGCALETRRAVVAATAKTG